MRQLTLNFPSTVVADHHPIAHGRVVSVAPVGGIHPLQPHREAVLTMPMPLPASTSMGFDFQGRILRHPTKSFQYRYGRKVQPPDEFLKKYKLDQYD